MGVQGQRENIVSAEIQSPSTFGGSSRRDHHNAYILSLLGTFDFRKKVTTIELRGVSTKHNGVGLKVQNRLHAVPIIGRDLISCIVERRGDVVPEALVGLHYQHFRCLAHNHVPHEMIPERRRMQFGSEIATSHSEPSWLLSESSRRKEWWRN